MITRREIYRLMGQTDVELNVSIAKLAHEVREPTECESWPEEIGKMIDKVEARYKNSNEAVKFLLRALKITQIEYQEAYDAYIFEMTKKCMPYAYYDSFDVIKGLIVAWILNAQKIFGYCEPELMYVHLLSEREGPFTRFNWSILRLTHKI